MMSLTCDCVLQLKVEPSGKLSIDADAARSLGLVGLSDHQLQLITAFLLSRPVCASEAALYLLEIQTIYKSGPVTYIHSAPSTDRFRIWNRAGMPLHN